MKTLTNHTPGLRGINLKDGGVHWLEAGASVELDPKDIVGDLPDLGTKPDQAAASEDAAELRAQVETLTGQVAERDATIAGLNEQLAKFDPDGDGKPGGSKAAEPVALTGKNKAELIDIAKAEGVALEDGATNADIVSAIELHREADAA